jgi:microcystin-dependent protein
MTDRIITGSADVQTTGSISFSDIFKRNKQNPVGTVTKSILSLAQFQAKAGDGWILAQGQSLSTSAYPELFAAVGYSYGGSGANFNIPNMQNRYTKSSGSFPVGTFQSNTTSTSGLSLSPGSAGFSGDTSFSKACSHNHGSGTLSSPIFFDYDKMYHNGQSEVSGPNISFPGSSTCKIGSGISNVTVYRCFVNLRGYSGTCTCSNTQWRVQSTFPTLGGGDSETKPESVVLNWFMRVK